MRTHLIFPLVLALTAAETGHAQVTEGMIGRDRSTDVEPGRPTLEAVLVGGANGLVDVADTTSERSKALIRCLSDASDLAGSTAKKRGELACRITLSAGLERDLDQAAAVVSGVSVGLFDLKQETLDRVREAEAAKGDRNALIGGIRSEIDRLKQQARDARDMARDDGEFTDEERSIAENFRRNIALEERDLDDAIASAASDDEVIDKLKADAATFGGGGLVFQKQATELILLASEHRSFVKRAHTSQSTQGGFRDTERLKAVITQLGETIRTLRGNDLKPDTTMLDRPTPPAADGLDDLFDDTFAGSPGSDPFDFLDEDVEGEGEEVTR